MRFVDGHATEFGQAFGGDSSKSPRVSRTPNTPVSPVGRTLANPLVVIQIALDGNAANHDALRPSITDRGEQLP